jgi:hypothetical protein
MVLTLKPTVKGLRNPNHLSVFNAVKEKTIDTKKRVFDKALVFDSKQCPGSVVVFVAETRQPLGMVVVIEEERHPDGTLVKSKHNRFLALGYSDARFKHVLTGTYKEVKAALIEAYNLKKESKCSAT